ncbi:hypothetical protein BC941DRAFT_418233 [Chlamydoabsidia padenii]|nr:hypothetical protein BC941DRAFT_418233 [Chlamydoabsidia padenii]
MELTYHQPQFTLAYIEWVMSNQDGRWQQQRLRDLQRTIQRQQKELRVFFLTVDALQVHYQQYQYSTDPLEASLVDQTHALQLHHREQERIEQELGQMENQLQHLRAYAIQRRNKKAKRERQYHEVYHVPMINTQYKKKYMRARDKNDAVEQQLSELHHTMDQIKDQLKQQRQQSKAVEEQRDALDQQRQQLTMELNDRKQLMVKMKQAQSFWCQFDTCHVQPCLDMLKQQHVDWTRLRLASVDYEEAERYGRHYYDHDTWDVVFDCTHCHSRNEGWPCLDKVRTTQLLCNLCYQETRTSMIVEKKLYSILPNNNNNDRLRLSTLSTSSSSLSIPSLISSTSKSTHSLINDCKPLVKKMKSALTMNQQQHKTDHINTSYPHLLSI